MQQYLNLVRLILETGDLKEDRTGTGTRSVFGHQMRFDLREGFPLLTTKKVLFDSVLRELLWFLHGKTNVNDGLGSKIWDAWADESGELGPIYGYQWRYWEKYRRDAVTGVMVKSHIDQIAEVIRQIKETPESRRIIVSAWNVSDLDEMALPPCHALFQFNVAGDFLDLQLYQRSADVALGVPFNIASYALLLLMVAKECGKIARHFIHTFGDAHIYQNHEEGLKTQLMRTPGELPRVEIADKGIFELKFEDFRLLDYVHGEFIRFPIAV